MTRLLLSAGFSLGFAFLESLLSIQFDRLSPFGSDANISIIAEAELQPEHTTAAVD